MEPEEAEVVQGTSLKYATRRGCNIFQLFDTKEQKDHFVASRRRCLEHQGERVALQECWQNEWQDIKYQGIMAKASVPREDFENAVAAARRRSVDFCGRQAQAACRV